MEMCTAFDAHCGTALGIESAHAYTSEVSLELVLKVYAAITVLHIVTRLMNEVLLLHDTFRTNCEI